LGVRFVGPTPSCPREPPAAVLLLALARRALLPGSRSPRRLGGRAGTTLSLGARAPGSATTARRCRCDDRPAEHALRRSLRGCPAPHFGRPISGWRSTCSIGPEPGRRTPSPGQEAPPGEPAHRPSLPCQNGGGRGAISHPRRVRARAAQSGASALWCSSSQLRTWARTLPRGLVWSSRSTGLASFGYWPVQPQRHKPNGSPTRGAQRPGHPAGAGSVGLRGVSPPPVAESAARANALRVW